MSMARIGGIASPSMLLTLLLTLIVWRLSDASSIEHGVWDYESNGPATWAQNYKKSCAGRKQSPIDLSSTSSVHDPQLSEFSMRVDETIEYGLTLENDGHKLQVTLGNNLQVKMGLGSKMYYTALQLHWHWGSDASKGSEHTVSGSRYPMEGHLVFYNSDDYKNSSAAMHGVNGLAVLGVLYELSMTDNPLVLAVERYLPQLIKSGSKLDIKLKANSTNFLDAFLPKSTRHFYRYEGSLTTPDCTENVLWTVYSTTVPISSRQLNALRTLRYTSGKPMANNYRPVLPLNPVGRPGANRVVYRTFDLQGRAFGDTGYTGGTAGGPTGAPTVTAMAFVAALSCLAFRGTT